MPKNTAMKISTVRLLSDSPIDTSGPFDRPGASDTLPPKAKRQAPPINADTMPDAPMTGTISVGFRR